MDDWIYFLFLLGSAALGAITGIWGQSIKERCMRAQLKAEIYIDAGGQIILRVYNDGKNSTRDLSIRATHAYESHGVTVTDVFYRNYDKEEIAPKWWDEYPMGSISDSDSKVHLMRNVNPIQIPIPKYHQPTGLIISISAQDVSTKNYSVKIFDNKLTFEEIKRENRKHRTRR